MKVNKLFLVLRSLNNQEFHQFGKFVRSPFFNQSENLIKFYDYLACYYPKFENDNLTKESAFNAIYPGEQYSDKKLRDRYAHMLKLAREYLGYVNHVDTNLEFRRNILNEYCKRELYNLIPSELEEMSDLIENTKIKDENYYLSRYLWEVDKRKYHPDELPFSKDKKITGVPGGEIDYIIHFFLIVMLKQYSQMFYMQNIIKSDYKWKFFEEIISYLSREKKSYEEVILVNILFHILQLYRNDVDETEIYKLKDLLDKNKDALETEVYNILYIELYNYCKSRQSRGKKEFGHLSFILTMEMLEKEVLLEKDGSMASHNYINIAASGMRFGNLEWAEQFINQYRNKVSVEFRENAYNYNYAVLCYMKGYGKDPNTRRQNYDAALDYLAKVKSEDFYYETRIKNHALKIYYELGYVESALSLIDSYHHYLSRNNLVPQDNMERYYNFITYLKRLLIIKSKEDNKGYPSLHALKKELSENVKTEYRGWMLDMINKLEMKGNDTQMKS